MTGRGGRRASPLLIAGVCALFLTPSGAQAATGSGGRLPAVVHTVGAHDDVVVSTVVTPRPAVASHALPAVPSEPSSAVRVAPAGGPDHTFAAGSEAGHRPAAARAP